MHGLVVDETVEDLSGTVFPSDSLQGQEAIVEPIREEIEQFRVESLQLFIVIRHGAYRGPEVDDELDAVFQ